MLGITYAPDPITEPMPTDPIALEVRAIREQVARNTAAARALVDEVAFLREENTYLRERLAEAGN